MAPKRNLDKAKAPMVDEEPRGPRTRFRSSALIIREQQEQAQEAEDKAAQMGTSSEAYEEADGTEEVRTEEIMGLRPERGEPSGREMTQQVAVGRSNEDRMSVMIDIMDDMMSQLRDVLARQNRAEVKRSPPRPLMSRPKGREMWSHVPEFLGCCLIWCWLSAQAAPLIAWPTVAVIGQVLIKGSCDWICCPWSFDLETLPGGFVQLGLGGVSAAWDRDHLGMLLDGMGMLFGAAVMDVIEPGDLGLMDDRVAAYDGFPLGFAGSDELAAADWAEKKMMGSAAGKKTAIEDR
ncbi:hypothetical protein ACLOJK_023318, partial [Asimina triloba]